jgi:hypothetical protein
MASFVVAIALAALVLSVVAVALSFPVARASIGGQSFLQANGFVATDGSGVGTVVGPTSILINSNPVPQILANNIAVATVSDFFSPQTDITPSLAPFGTGLTLPVSQLSEGTMLVFTLGGQYETGANGVYELSIRHGNTFTDSGALMKLVASSGDPTVDSHEKEWQTTIMLRCSNLTADSVTFYNTGSFTSSFSTTEGAHEYGFLPNSITVNTSILHFFIGFRMLAPVNLESFTLSNLNLLRYG